MQDRKNRVSHAAFLTLFMILVACSACPLQAQEGDPNSRPNVIFVLTDDQRWDQLSCEGHPYLETPHIDRLADEGVRFSHAFVTTSLCSPSRASYLSGLYAHTHGVVNNFTDYPKDLPSYPRQLKAAGYQTAYIGKWHMGEADDSRRPGFDYWISHRGQGDYFDTEFNVNGKRQVVPGYYTSTLTQMTVDYLREKRTADRPFCLIVGHKAPHTPFTPEPKYQDLFKDVCVDYPHSAFDLTGKPKWIEDRLDTWHGIYGPIYGFRKEFPDRSAPSVMDFQRFALAYTASIKSIDDSVGEMVATLEELELLDNTIIVYAGDNGMFLGEHGMTDKRSMHEPSIRVPLIVRYSARIRPGQVRDDLVLNVDVAPSILEWCDAEPIPNIHGQSFAGLLEDVSAKWRDAFFYEYNYEKQFPYTPNVRGVRTRDWKYVHYPHGDGSPDRHLPELYHLASDPGERHNLSQDPRYQKQMEYLKTRLQQLQKKTGGLPDKMPLDEGIKTELPDEDIR